MAGFFGRQPVQIAPTVYDGLNVGSSLMDLPVPIFWGQRRLGTNAIWYNNFQKHSVGAKGKGGAGVKGYQQYDYTAATICALCEGPVDSIQNIWPAGSTTTTVSLAYLNLTFFDGSATQSPWSYVVSNYPTQARSYALTAYLANPKQDLGEAAAIPNNEFECVRTASFATYVHSTPGWIDPYSHAQDTAVDCLMSDILSDLLTNVQYGIGGFSGADLGDASTFATYCQAQGLFFSPYLNSAEKATSIIDRWAQLSNTWIYWDGISIRYVPLGDSTVTGNGATFAPDTSVAYALTIDAFLDKDAPVKVSRLDPADAPNRTVVNITDRTIGYITNPIEYKDQTLYDQYGLRDNTSLQADEICDPLVGKIVAQLVGKRAAYIRNSYTFKLSWQYIRVLPGTILSIPEPNIGIDVNVRVKTVEEDADGNLSITAEEFPGNIGTYYAATGAAATATPASSVPDQFVSAGNVNTPAIVEPNSAFTNGEAVLIIAASGGANWGGCQVNISFDGVNYTNIGTISAAAIQGTLTAALPAYGGTNPDTTDTLAVDCTESETVPSSVSNSDAQSLRTLSLVAAQPTVSGAVSIVPTNGELLAFGDVTPTGTYTANLTYLERAAYGTTAGAHSIGDQFTVIDVSGTAGTSVRFPLPAQYIGQTLYLKLASFNLFHNVVQDLSTVVEYQYTPSGMGYGGGSGGVPAIPTGLAVTTAPVLSWNSNPATDNVTSYKVYRATGTSQPFSSASLVYSGLALGWADTTAAPSTAYTYFVVAANAVGNSSPSTGVNVTTGAGALTSFSQGTFTPNDASGASLTFSGVSFAYTQIGNIVHIYGTLTYPTTANTNQAKIGNLPFTVANQSYADLIPSGSVNGQSVSAAVCPMPSKNTKSFFIEELTSRGGVTNANLSGADLIIAFWYPIA